MLVKSWKVLPLLLAVLIALCGLDEHACSPWNQPERRSHQTDFAAQRGASAATSLRNTEKRQDPKRVRRGLRPSCDTKWFHQWRWDKYPRSIWTAKCVSPGSPCQVGKAFRKCLEVRHKLNSLKFVGKTTDGRNVFLTVKDTITVNCMCSAS